MKNNHQKMGDLLTTLVFALFAVCLLLVLLSGAGVYRGIADEAEARFSRDTAARYLATRVRQGHDIRLEDFAGVQALTFREEIDGEVFFTRVYCYDGHLWELYTPAGGAFAPADGERLLELEQLDMQLQAGVLRADLGARQLVLTLREGRQVQP